MQHDGSISSDTSQPLHIAYVALGQHPLQHLYQQEGTTLKLPSVARLAVDSERSVSVRSRNYRSRALSKSYRSSLPCTWRGEHQVPGCVYFENCVSSQALRKHIVYSEARHERLNYSP